MKKVLIALAAFGLCACATAPSSAQPAEPAEPVDLFTLHIETGRYGVMLSQIEGYEEGEASEIPVDSPVALAATLRETAWEYNLTRSRYCRAGVFPAMTCGPAYAPDWLTEAPDASPSPATLQARSRDLGGRVMALWNEVCEAMDADKPRTDDGIVMVEDRSCPME